MNADVEPKAQEQKLTSAVVRQGASTTTGEQSLQQMELGELDVHVQQNGLGPAKLTQNGPKTQI